MQGLTEGQIVHHVQQLDGMVGTVEYAAIVSRVYDAHNPKSFPADSLEAYADTHADGDVRLHVMTENTVTVLDPVPFSAEKLPNTWHWPEKA